MTQAPKKPLVILPAGPAAWPSHQYIIPELRKLWNGLGFSVIEQWLPAAHIDSALLESAARASILIFPLGMIQADALRLLEVLRRSYGINTPACLMYTSGVNVGANYLHKYHKILRSSDRLVMNCSAEIGLIRSFLKSPKPAIYQAALPVDESLFIPPTSAERARSRSRLGLTPDEKIVLYTGRISAQKNLNSLLAVIHDLKKRVPNLRLMFVGQVDHVGVPHVLNQNFRSYPDELSLSIHHFGLKDAVEFRPYASQKELTGYLKAADVHASLSLHSCEDYGYGIAQGLACGIPTLISKWGGGIDFAESGLASGIRVFPTMNGPRIDFNQAARELEILLGLDSLAARSKRGILFRKKFGHSQIARQWAKATTPARPRVGSVPIAVLRRKAPPFKAGEKAFLEFLRIYSGAKPRGSRFFYLNPLFMPERCELADCLAPKRFMAISRSDRKALLEFGFGPRGNQVFSRKTGPALSPRSFDRLVAEGILLPSG